MTSRLLSRRMLITLVLGVSSGLPLPTTLGTLQAWMQDVGINIKQIGLYALVGLPYTLKFLWAPVMDRFVPPFLGRRRGWILITQIMVMAALVGLGLTDPAQNPVLTAIMALVVSFSSASQDIVLDAHRRDTLRPEEFAFGTSLFVTGYRIGMLFSGALALVLADHLSWPLVYTFIAGGMLIGVAGNLFAPEPEGAASAPKTMQEAVIGPLRDLFQQHAAVVMLAFILLYKLGDTLASSLSTPYILSLGYSKTELAGVVKTFGMLSLIGGGLIGGLVVMRIGIARSLWVFGVLQVFSVLSFAILPLRDIEVLGFPALTVLGLIIAFENLCFGMGTSAFTAFLGERCSVQFSATQYALLSSIVGIPRVILSSYMGFVAASLGWPMYFVFCAATALPGMALLLIVAPWRASPKSPAPSDGRIAA